MSFMNRLPRINAALAPNYGPLDDRSYFPGGSYYGESLLPITGMAVTPENALRLLTVQKCVRFRAATFAQLPIQAFEKLEGDDFKEDSLSPLRVLLNDQPNVWMQAPFFWSMVETFICTKGNFIAYKLGIEGRPTQQLIPITNRVLKIIQNDDYTLTYQVRLRSGAQEDIPQSKILHFRSLCTLDGISGVSPIEYAAEQIGVSKSQITFLANYFDKGMHPGAIFKHKLTLDPVTHANKREALKKKYGGLGKAWEMMLIDEDMTVEFPKMTLVDAQYLEIMKMGEAEICGLYRVPLILVQAGDKTPTYNSSEQLDIHYAKHGIAPDCRNYEKTCESSLMSAKDRETKYLKFNLDALMRGDFKTRMDGLSVGVINRILNPNEARKKLDMPPYVGGEKYENPNITVKKDTSNNDDSPDDDAGDKAA